MTDMNKYIRICSVCLLSAAILGCEQPVLVEQVQMVNIEAAMEVGQDTKTYLSYLSGGMYYPVWDMDDAIAVYSEEDSDPSRFGLMQGEHTTSATFTGVGNGTCSYGLYPFDMAGTFQNGKIHMTLPYEQEYQPGSFGYGSFPMVATSGDDGRLYFKNLCAIMKISIKGDKSIRSIKLTPNNAGLYMSGDAEVSVNYSTAPQLTMLSSGTRSVVLNCDGVQLQPSVATDFHIVIPAQTYYGGLTVEIDAYDQVITKNIASDLVFLRSQIRHLRNLDLQPESPDIDGPGDDDSGDYDEDTPSREYVSKDYSQDGAVVTLQTATTGNGIDVVLMGDAYSDRQIANGLYEQDMRTLYNNLFTEEPYKSFKHYFNVYYIKVVSEMEGYYGATALDTYFGEGTLVGGNDETVYDYTLNVLPEERVDEAMMIVVMNQYSYAGTCYMYYPYDYTDYSSGPTISYFPKGEDELVFAELLHHEANGHGFAKLADEYAYEEMGRIPDDYKQETIEMQDYWGWFKNIDFTSDVTKVRWSHFIEDSRYDSEGLGAYQGGDTYWRGVWRPTYNSIMRYNTDGFNAPSREAIYYRMHKLAFGDSWEYDYETFVEQDLSSRSSHTSHGAAGNYVERRMRPTTPPVVVGRTLTKTK